ncbi:MAG: ion transporter [Candidatus Marinimicrobia bacterium]|nr:ion transporter [Candidatus Neomarinimicrobiota bacterium]|tara:strand:+ start:2299 stop:3105 length:807 start_codon:yes stop_codon:yes gene_type:complete
MGKIKDQLRKIIFGTETLSGRLFDILLIIAIISSVLIVMLDSVLEYHNAYGNIFLKAEWIFTILFTIEYLTRIYCIRLPSSYIFSFFGIIDFLAILPTYISLIIPGAAVFSVIRILRVLRVFRVLKLVQFMGEAELLKKAMIASKRKIFVYLFFLLNLVIVLGSIMYLIEGEKSGFDSIPRSIYWAIVTLTTVGYGDISPTTNLGQFIAAIIMIMGYSIIAVPTGIVTSSMNFTKDGYRKTCIICNDDRQTRLAKFCNKCGAKMPEES